MRKCRLSNVAAIKTGNRSPCPLGSSITFTAKCSLHGRNILFCIGEADPCFNWVKIVEPLRLVSREKRLMGD